MEVNKIFKYKIYNFRISLVSWKILWKPMAVYVMIHIIGTAYAAAAFLEIKKF